MASNCCFSQTITLISPQQHCCITWTALCLPCSSACTGGKLLLWMTQALRPHQAVWRSPSQGQRSLVQEEKGTAPSAGSLFLPAGKGDSEGHCLQPTSQRALSSCPRASTSEQYRSTPQRCLWECVKTTWCSNVTYLYSVVKPTEPQALQTQNCSHTNSWTGCHREE